jgi:hypothetical protein
MASSTDVKGQAKIAWKDKKSAQKGDQWNLMMRALRIKYGAEEPPLTNVLDYDHTDNQLWPVLDELKIPASLATRSSAAVAVFGMQIEKRERDRKKSKDHNKKRQATHAKALVVLQDLFAGGSNVALCISGAIDETSKNKVKQFRKAFAALSAAFEPSGTVDSMQLKEDLKVWADAGMSHSDWEAGFGRISNQLTVLGDPLPLKEMDQIVIKNVKNPYLSGIKTTLILEAYQPRSVCILM